jgi:putative FmdB family regulatory protein
LLGCAQDASPDSTELRWRPSSSGSTSGSAGSVFRPLEPRSPALPAPLLQVSPELLGPAELLPGNLANASAVDNTRQYECTPCLVVYEVMHGMNDPPLRTCPRCRGSVTRLISAPRLNRYNFSGPTEAKYAKVSPQSLAEKELSDFSPL